MEYKDDNFIIKYFNYTNGGTYIFVKSKSGRPFTYFVIKYNDGMANRCKYYIRICVFLGSTPYIIKDTSLINEEDFNAMCGESRFDIAKYIYDTYLYRHGLAIKAEYKMIDDEQLYNSEEPFNKMVSWCNPHYYKKKCI